MFAILYRLLNVVCVYLYNSHKVCSISPPLQPWNEVRKRVCVGGGAGGDTGQDAVLLGGP